MSLPIDFSIHGSEKSFSGSGKSPLPFLTPNMSRFLSSVSDLKLPRFLGNISNPIFWRHFPPYVQYDQKVPFNPGMFDQMSAKSSRSRFNHFQMSSSRLFSPPHSFLDKLNYCKGSGSSNPLPNLFETWNPSSGSEKAPLIPGFTQTPTLMIHLQSGVKKRLEEITEFDLWHCTKENDQFNPQWSEVIHISQLSDEKKIEITFLTNKKQIIYQTDLHRPFFVKNLGWCSLFPALTQKLFGLQCSVIDVGHSCLTLSRKRKPQVIESSPNTCKRSKESPRSHLSFHSNKL